MPFFLLIPTHSRHSQNEIYSFRFTLYCVQLNAIEILLSWCFSFSALFLHLFLELRHPSLLILTHNFLHVPIRWRDEWKSNWKVLPRRMEMRRGEKDVENSIQSNKSKSGRVWFLCIWLYSYVYVYMRGKLRFCDFVTFIKIYNPF